MPFNGLSLFLPAGAIAQALKLNVSMPFNGLSLFLRKIIEQVIIEQVCINAL